MAVEDLLKVRTLYDQKPTTTVHFNVGLTL